MHELLEIPAAFRRQCKLPLCREPRELVATEADYYGRPQRLLPAAFSAWTAMKTAAADAGIRLHLISAFRDIDYQYQLLQRKLEAGQSLEQILTVNAAPGYSEHHTGRAIDVGTMDCAALVTEFEDTAAFTWLQKNAADFGFFLSYPHDNPFGIGYEPWHWCYRAGLPEEVDRES